LLKKNSLARRDDHLLAVIKPAFWTNAVLHGQIATVATFHKLGCGEPHIDSLPPTGPGL
jgi:hypothetical protein